MDYKTIFEKVSLELNIPVKVVEYAYKSYWKFIREKIKELPLKDIKDEEEFLKLRTNFNIPSLSKSSKSYAQLYLPPRFSIATKSVISVPTTATPAA